MLQATRTIPIIFVHVPDPIGAGFVDSLARPGGNLTVRRISSRQAGVISRREAPR
jgi:ABC transporter substrate binding protein